MARKYNPDVHSSVVSNYRRAYQEEYTQKSTLSDERIWDISNEWVGLEGGPLAEDAAILEQMNDEQDPEIADAKDNHGQAMGYFSYCLACKRAVPDVSNPCTGCNSAKDMVDWVEPSRDCTMLIDGKDCIERGWDSDEVICLACASWLKWEQARPKR